MRKIVSILLTMVTLLSLSIVTVGASSESMSYTAAESVIAEEIVFGDDIIDFSTLKLDVPTPVTINLVGMSLYVDFSNMDNSFDASTIDYITDNPDVAYAWDGRILATGQGTTDIILDSDNGQYTIRVTVKENISEELEHALEYVSRGNVLARTSNERQSIVDKGREMASLLWTPTSNLTGWRGSVVFQAGKVYSGIPYSMTVNQCDEESFVMAMRNSDFYSSYTRTLDNETIIMPKYGSDCSGFVSFAWGISRATTVTFNNYPSIGGYENLQPGDAVVYRNAKKQEGHIILVSTNFVTPPSNAMYQEPYLVCYEQTPYKAAITFHKYSSLSSGGYKAISKFNN